MDVATDETRSLHTLNKNTHTHIFFLLSEIKTDQTSILGFILRTITKIIFVLLNARRLGDNIFLDNSLQLFLTRAYKCLDSTRDNSLLNCTTCVKPFGFLFRKFLTIFFWSSGPFLLTDVA